MFENKKVLILDDDKTILQGLKMSLESKAPNNQIDTISSYTESFFEYILDYDVAVFDFYFDSAKYTPDVIKEVKKLKPEIFIVCCSGAFVVEHGTVTSIDNNSMKDCLNAGANRVGPKNSEELFEMIDVYFKIKASST